MSVATDTIRLDTNFESRRAERIFYTGMTLLIVITVFGGFAKTFYLRGYFLPAPLPTLLVLHGIAFSSWIALLLTQTSLIAAKRIDTHRKLGIAGGILATLMVIIGTLTGIVRAKVFDVPAGTSPLTFLTIPLGDMLVFGILIAAGFYWRRRKAAHKTLMMLATISILPAAVARLPFDFIVQGGALAFFGLPDLLILPLLAFEYFFRGRVQLVTILGALLLVVSHPLRFVVGNTQAWLTFATWLTQWT